MNNISPHFLIPPVLERELRDCVSLPSLPSIAVKLIDASKDPDISLREVSSIISSDPAISVKLLKIANSSLYSQRRAVNNLREALTLLGFNASLTIALSFSLFQSLKSSDNKNFKHENYWKRSILSAEIARMLGSRLGLSSLEDLFLASLLQDIGILVLENIKQSPYICDEGQRLKHTECIRLEQKILGVEHSLVGAWLLNSWHFPIKLVNAVLYSHSLSNNKFKQTKSSSRFHQCLCFSGSLADLWLEDEPDELQKATLKATKIFLNINEVECNKLINDINNELPELSSLFEVGLMDEIERGQLLDEARELSLVRSLYFVKQYEDAHHQLENIEEQVKTIEKENEQDHLTKVYNRKHIDRLLPEEYELANINRWPLSLAFIDIDNFKEINDSYGHLAGDQVIISIAEFFVKNIRQTDTLARYGGDEFILVLPGSTLDIGRRMLERLVKLLSDELKIEFEGKVLNPSVSVGLVSHMDQHDFDDITSFISAADNALYKAKSAGRNCVAIY